MSTKLPDIPSMPSSVDSNIRRAFDVIRGIFKGINSGGGVVSQSDLFDSGLVDSSGNAIVTETTYSTPQIITGLTANGAFRLIIIEWDEAQGASYVEVHRSTSNNVGTAEYIGSTSASVFSDAPPQASLAVTYYYWVRGVLSVGDNKIVGPWNAVSGTPASTANDPAYVLDMVSKSLDEVDPQMTGPSIVFAAEKFAVRSVSETPNQAKYMFVVDSTYGVIMDVALIRDLTATNIKVGTLTGDRFAADTISASKIKTSELIVGYNVTMGAGATISWSNVTSRPTIPTNTNQLTDGAGLGTTANWSSVSGRPNTTYIDANGVYTGTLTATQVNTSGFVAQTANIGDLQVSTLKIADNAVTIPISSYTESAISLPYGVETTIQQLYVDATYPTELFLSAFIIGTYAGTTYYDMQVRVYRGSTLIYTCTLVAQGRVSVPWSACIKDSPGGTYTYYVKCYSTSGSNAGSATNRSIVAITTKK